MSTRNETEPSPIDEGEARRFWRDLAPALGRERVAAGLLGEPSGAADICTRRWRARPAGGSGRAEEAHELLVAVLADPVGADLPLATRLQVARACTSLSYEALGREALRLGSADTEQLDRALSALGVPVVARLAACGLGTWPPAERAGSSPTSAPLGAGCGR